MFKELTNKSKVFIHITLIIGAIAMITPFIWMILTSGKTQAESTMIPPQIFPENFQWENYKNVWGALPFIKFYWNTGVMIAGRVLDRKSTRLNSSHVSISYAVFCLKKKKKTHISKTHT